ncbi:hypothetical protein AKJ16_DCAP21725 [Drosera capensis]
MTQPYLYDQTAKQEMNDDPCGLFALSVLCKASKYPMQESAAGPATEAQGSAERRLALEGHPAAGLGPAAEVLVKRGASE